MRICIVDDQAIFRKSMTMMLHRNWRDATIEEWSTGWEFLKQLEQGIQYDLVLMDIEMPILDGINTTAQATKTNPKIPILAITMFWDRDKKEEMQSAGARGFITKTANKENLINAFSIVMSGAYYFTD